MRIYAANVLTIPSEDGFAKYRVVLACISTVAALTMKLSHLIVAI